MTGPTGPILAAGCGNPMAGDDAFGPRVIDALARAAIPGLETISLGMDPSALVDHLADRSGLIVVDAVQVPDTPVGQLMEVDWFARQRPAWIPDAGFSTHGVSVADLLTLAERLGQLPARVCLIGCAIASATVGDEPTPAVREAVPSAARRVARLARQWQQPEGAHAS